MILVQNGLVWGLIYSIGHGVVTHLLHGVENGPCHLHTWTWSCGPPAVHNLWQKIFTTDQRDNCDVLAVWLKLEHFYIHLTSKFISHYFSLAASIEVLFWYFATLQQSMCSIQARHYTWERHCRYPEKCLICEVFKPFLALWASNKYLADPEGQLQYSSSWYWLCYGQRPQLPEIL